MASRLHWRTIGYSRNKADEVEFTKTEIIFYVAMFVASGFACLARIWRDNERADIRTVFGRCLSSGFLSFGVVAIWIGSNPDSSAGSGAYWMAIATLVGYCSRDIQDQILTRGINWIINKFGGPGDVEK
jgi:hypothetical protein